ncbi:MAG TPA: glycosyl hydrolase family 65 protein [Opitutaceae bacterium]|nr:glycosyl hydrolase family 65 protein [Opitutaceae bacterium]
MLAVLGLLGATPLATPLRSAEPTTAQRESGGLFDGVPTAMARLAMDGSANILAQEQLWVPGGGLSVNPHLGEVGSFLNFVAPPWATTGFACRLVIDGAPINASGYRWLPGEFQSEGTLPSGVRVSSVLSPLVAQRGLIEAIRLHNPTAQPVRLTVRLTLAGEFAKIPKNKWTFGAVTRRTPPGVASPVEWAVAKWRRDPATPGAVIASSDEGVILANSDLPTVVLDRGEWTGDITLAPSAARMFSLVLGVGTAADASALMRAHASNASDANGLRANVINTNAGDTNASEVNVLDAKTVATATVTATAKAKALAANSLEASVLAGIAANRKQWAQRIEELYRRLPRLSSSSRELVDFYDRSLTSYLVGRWDGPDFVTQPYFPTSGLDGGAFCLYAWDYAYTAMLHPLVQPETDRAIIKLLLKAGLFNNYAVLPFDGEPSGPWYAYNHYAITQLIYYYVLHTGDRAFLAERVNGRTVLEWAREHAVYLDHLDAPVTLIDYGTNNNLLELHRTDAYLHFVPSPNAERCWSYRAVDEMAGWAGVKPFGLARRADELAAVIHRKLWDAKARWFSALDVGGHPKLCYSIQIFDLLRQGILTADERSGILTHLKEPEFLSPWGVHSLATSDPGYDETDVDWGGPGVYAGDAPQLVQDLLGAGAFSQADDLLRRILWWGQRLPYFPQAIRADRADYRHDGRANVIAGATGAQAVIFGLLGCAVKPDGSIELNPHLPAFAKDLAFTGLKLRGRILDVTLDREGYRITVDGQPVPPKPYGTPCILSSSQQSRKVATN